MELWRAIQGKSCLEQGEQEQESFFLSICWFVKIGLFPYIEQKEVVEQG